MAGHPPLLTRIPGQLEADSVALAVGLVTLADEDTPLLEMIARCVERIRGVFQSAYVAGLIINASQAPSFTQSDRSPTFVELSTELHRALPLVENVVVANDLDLRLIDGQRLLDELVDVPEADCFISSEAQVNGQSVVLLVHVAKGDEQLQATQDALRTLTTALFARRRSALYMRERVRRAATLYTMLEDIASNLDVDQVLATIVERARHLLSADCAYLSEVDEVTRKVTMRATSGIRDAGYKCSTSELGQTLFGAVATSRQVMHTHDYVADPRFIHTAVTDANVMREGIKEIIAAPLQVSNRVVGVLGVANRCRTDFSPDDLDLVRSLASGAAIALENARLYSEQRKLVEQLRELNALTSKQHEALKRSVFVHDQLTELVLQGHDIGVIAQRLAMLIANPVVVLGPNFNLLAYASIDSREASIIAMNLAASRDEPEGAADWLRMTTEQRPIRRDRERNDGIAPSLIVAPVAVGSDLVAYIVIIEGGAQFGDLDAQALQQASTVFALELTRARVVAEVENRLGGDFVHDLLSGTFDQNAVIERAGRLGHDLRRPQVILAAAPDPPLEGEPVLTDVQVIEQGRCLERALRASFRNRGCMAQTSIIGNIVVTLLALPTHDQQQPDEPNAIVRGVQIDLTASLAPLTVSVGMSRVCLSLSDLARAHSEALMALKKGQRFDSRGALNSFSNLGVERILGLLPDSHELSRYVDHVLGSLLKYDAEHGTHLMITLEAYLNCGGRLRETARTVGIHVNSLEYRLQRIQQIGDIALQDPETRLDAWLALRAWHMLSTIESHV